MPPSARKFANGPSRTANLLVFPNLDSANIAFNLMKQLGDGLAVGPVLLGTARPVHILTPSVTARGILNMTAVAAVGAQQRLKSQTLDAAGA